MINEKIYNKLLKEAVSSKNNLDVSLDRLTSFFQPYFKDDIFVDYQPSDGFVIVVAFKNNDVSNIILNHALEEIELNPRYYIDCDFK